jgi:hypothetical protein
MVVIYCVVVCLMVKLPNELPTLVVVGSNPIARSKPRRDNVRRLA